MRKDRETQEERGYGLIDQGNWSHHWLEKLRARLTRATFNKQSQWWHLHWHCALQSKFKNKFSCLLLRAVKTRATDILIFSMNTDLQYLTTNDTGNKHNSLC